MTATVIERSHEQNLELFVANRKLVTWFIRREKNLCHGINALDLKQELRLVLWNCCKYWDESKAKLSTYCTRSFRHKVWKLREDMGKGWHIRGKRDARIIVASDIYRDPIQRQNDPEFFSNEDPLPDWIKEENRKELNDTVRKVLASSALTAQERKAVESLYLGAKRRTLQDVADKMGLSRERIRQLSQHALTKLGETLLILGIGPEAIA